MTYNFDWTVTQPAAAGYVIRVWHVGGDGNWLFYDDSPSAFEIQAGSLPQPTVTLPGTAGPFVQGAIVPIEWTLAAATGSGIFHAYAFASDGTYHWIMSVPAEAGRMTYNFDWTVIQPAAAGYVIRVWYVDIVGNWLFFDDSDVPFQITTGP